MIRLFDPAVPEDRPAVERATPRAHDSGCRACTAWEGSSVVCMRPESAAGTGPTLLVVSTSPEQVDLDLGRHLAGKRGRWLRDQIAARWQGRVVFDYAVRCHVGKTAPNRTWYDACRSYLARTVEKCRPDRVLCIGSTSAVGLLGRPVDAYSARRAWAYLPATKSTVYVIGHFHEWYGNRILTAQVEKTLDWALLQAPPAPPPLDAVALRWTPEDDPGFQVWLKAAGEVTYDVETFGRQSDDDFKLIAASMARDDSSEVWCWAEEDLAPGSESAEVFADALECGLAFPAHNRRFDDRSVRRHLSIPYPPGPCTMLDWKLLHGDAFVALATVQDAVGMGGSKDEIVPYIEAESRRLRAQAKVDAAGEADPEAALRRSHRYNEPLAYAYAAIPRDMLLKYCAKDTLSTSHVRRLTRQKLSQFPDFERTMGELIMPLSGALNRMETHGVRVVREHARDLQTYFGARIKDLKGDLSAAARSLVGDDINWKSTKQLQEFLYDPKPDGLGLTPPWATKSGAPSTEKAALEKLAGEAPIINKLLAYRGVEKLSTTYAWGLERYICDDDRIHTNYKIHGAETARLSCVAGWTLIKTQRGDVPISEVIAGDFVWTHKGRWRRVLRAFTKGLGEMVDVRFSNGKVLTCTLDHRILDVAGKWRRIEEVVDEFLEAVGCGRVEPGQRLAALQELRAAHNGADRGGAGDAFSERLSRHQSGDDGARAQNPGEGALLSVEDRREEPDDREDPRSTSQLEGCGRGRSWVSDDLGGGPPGVPAPSRDGGSAGPRPASGEAGRSPYRRGSEEQRAGQPCRGHSAWAQGDPRTADGGLADLQVEAVHYRGRLEVHDLSVEDDESYLACGVLSHNSSNPNLQNIPSGESDDPARAADGKRIKALFLPTDGDWTFVFADYSQLEIRVAAMLSGDLVMQQMLASGVDFHLATARLIAPFFGEDPVKVDKKHWLRRSAKVTNFACIAAGSLVLTNRGLVPIEDISACDLVWDGIEWVSHDGVIYKGEQDVVTYDGLTATLDHKVWVHNGRRMSLSTAREARAKLARTAREAEPMRVGFVDTELRNAAAQRNAEIPRRRRRMQPVCQALCVSSGQHLGWEDHGLSVYAGSEVRVALGGRSSAHAGYTLRLNGTALSPRYTCVEPQLQGARNRSSVQVEGRVHLVGADNVPGYGLQGSGFRSNRQRGTLRAGESPASDAVGEPTQSTKAHVYDILNAGPRHRFTVSGVLVSNCLYGKGDQGLAEELGVSIAIAAKVRAAILGRFTRLAAWLRERVEEARSTGAVWIYRFGDVPSRRRPLPNIASPKSADESNAKNGAFNTPIQGAGSEYMLASVVGIDMVLHNIKLNEWQRTAKDGAWDHVDKARCRYHKTLRGRAKQVLTVHDSGGGDVRKEVSLEYAAMMRDVMEGWPSLGVKLPADLSCGDSWGDLETLEL